MTQNGKSVYSLWSLIQGLQESKKKAKQLSIPYLLRNQTPHSPVGAHGVPGVQAITARPQDMTNIP